MPEREELTGYGANALAVQDNRFEAMVAAGMPPGLNDHRFFMEMFYPPRLDLKVSHEARAFFAVEVNGSLPPGEIRIKNDRGDTLARFVNVGTETP